jgi:hypothetical protein
MLLLIVAILVELVGIALLAGGSPPAAGIALVVTGVALLAAGLLMRGQRGSTGS